MASTYPGSADSFSEPTEPEGTPLSESGTGSRNHYEHHRDLGDAVEAIEANASLKGHDHSGSTSDIAHGNKLSQANTHENGDLDTSVAAWHHTLGKGALQAAPGNHVHSYNDLLDRPYIVCTSSTRPSPPFIGMLIYETDTNTVRIWAEFPTNPEATGIIASDNFHRSAPSDLGATLWELHYLFGDNVYGFLSIWNWGSQYSYGYSAWWTTLLTTSNYCLARRINDDDKYTQTDDQEIECSWGDHDFDHHHSYGQEAPCNDHFFRMSDDRLHYVRVAVFYSWVMVYYTVNGAANEVALGFFYVPVWEPGLIWTISCIDWGIHVYRNGVHCGSVYDNDHHHYKDSDHRGWGIGTHVVGYSGGQYRAPDIADVKIKDKTSYTPVSRWGLLPVANMPIFIAEATARLQVPVGMEMAIVWGNIVNEWVFAPFWSESAAADIVITEPGVYHVHASISWDPGYYFADHGMISVKVNGQDISRKHWEFLRGNNYAPGFAQTQEINFWYRFNAGDKLHVVAAHNGSVAMWTWYDLDDPNRQLCYVECAFHSP